MYLSAEVGTPAAFKDWISKVTFKSEPCADPAARVHVLFGVIIISKPPLLPFAGSSTAVQVATPHDTVPPTVAAHELLVISKLPICRVWFEPV